MPTKTTEGTKTSTRKVATRKKVAAKKKPATRKPPMVKATLPTQQPTNAHVCASCNALPVGSIELTALLLVLVFSLTAVLVTSVHALALQEKELESVQTYYQVD